MGSMMEAVEIHPHHPEGLPDITSWGLGFMSERGGKQKPPEEPAHEELEEHNKVSRRNTPLSGKTNVVARLSWSKTRI